MVELTGSGMYCLIGAHDIGPIAIPINRQTRLSYTKHVYNATFVGEKVAAKHRAFKPLQE